jgi:hypothetical protein
MLSKASTLIGLGCSRPGSDFKEARREILKGQAEFLDPLEMVLAKLIKKMRLLATFDTCDGKAALRLMRKLLKKHGVTPATIVTDRLGS